MNATKKIEYKAGDIVVTRMILAVKNEVTSLHSVCVPHPTI